MKSLIRYYCYQDSEIYVSPIKPKGFDQMDCCKVYNAPNITVARDLYETDLKIMDWRIHGKGQKRKEGDREVETETIQTGI